MLITKLNTATTAAVRAKADRYFNARLRELLNGVLSGVGGAVSAPTDVQMISVGALELDDEDD